MSFIALTERSLGSHAGSTRTPGSAPSPIFQKIQKRFHSLYDGHVRVEPAQSRGDLVVVLGCRPHPRRGPLEHHEVLDVVGDLGDELHRARAGSDHRDPLAAQVDASGPTAPSGTTGLRTSRDP